MDNVPVKKKSEKTVVVYFCNICGREFANRDTLRAHCKKIHKLRLDLPKATLTCPLCKDLVHNSDELDKHLSLVHNISLEHTKLTFKTEGDFKVWKSNIEKETKSSYICRSHKTREKIKIIYYRCHRSGEHTPRLLKKPVRQRSIKLAGSNKIGCVCPARIRACINKKGCVEVDYVSQHVGHECEVERLRLTTSERENIVAKLMKGVPYRQIVDTFNANTQSKLITNHDLHNIKRDLNINIDVGIHQDDAESVANLVKKYQHEVEDPVLWYKPYGQEDSVVGKDNFVLIFMNSVQKEFLCKYGNDILMIDSTYGINPYKIQLTTLMVVDNDLQGFPVAFLWSITQSEIIFQKFFQCLKEKVPVLTPKTFMSNETNAFYNAFLRTYNYEPHKLLCDWHVKTNITENLIKIENIERRNYVKKTILKLINELDEQTFTVMHENILNELLNDQETLTYGQYFLTYYSKRPKEWAHCFRKNLRRNTNVCLKKWHQEVKRNQETRDRCQERLDYCINNVLECLRMKFMRRLVHLHRNKMPSKLHELRKRHKLAEAFRVNAQIFVQVTNSKWQVSSSTDQSGQPSLHSYEVSLNDTPHFYYPFYYPCDFLCNECNRCIHEFSCTCPDYTVNYNMCKHIHLVGIEFPKDHQPVVDVDVPDPCSSHIGNIAREKESENAFHHLNEESSCALYEEKKVEVLEKIKKLEEMSSSCTFETLSDVSEMLSSTISRIQTLKRPNYDSCMIPSKDM